MQYILHTDNPEKVPNSAACNAGVASAACGPGFFDAALPARLAAGEAGVVRQELVQKSRGRQDLAALGGNHFAAAMGDALATAVDMPQLVAGDVRGWAGTVLRVMDGPMAQVSSLATWN